MALASGQTISASRINDELYLAIEDIDHTRTKARSPQTNGICERFHKCLTRNELSDSSQL